MQRSDVDIRRGVWIPQANPISTVVPPGLVDHRRLAVELERDSVVLKPVPPDVANAFHGSQEFEQRPKGEPAARHLKAA
jgi:hypothetical protein